MGSELEVFVSDKGLERRVDAKLEEKLKARLVKFISSLPKEEQKRCIEEEKSWREIHQDYCNNSGKRVPVGANKRGGIVSCSCGFNYFFHRVKKSPWGFYPAH